MIRNGQYRKKEPDGFFLIMIAVSIGGFIISAVHNSILGEIGFILSFLSNLRLFDDSAK